MRIFPSKVVSKKSNIHHRTLLRWIEKDLIKPKLYESKTRNPIYFTEEEFREVIVLARLRKLISFKDLKKALEYIREFGYNGNLFSYNKFALVDSEKLVMICEDKKAFEIIGKHKGQMVMVSLLDIDETINTSEAFNLD